MTNLANDNYRPVTTGQCFYPEMGERHDGSALFVRQVGYGGYYLKWSCDRHSEALAVFKKLRIRPSSMSLSESVKGGIYWSAYVTYMAGRKVRSHSVLECLLD